MAESIIIEFIADTSQLAPAEDKLVALGKIDQQSAAVFKSTNDQIKQRNALLGQTVDQNEKLKLQVTDEQAIYNKLVSSVKNLSGASKEAVQNLLKMSPKEVSAGFDQAAVSVDDYVAALLAAGEAGDDTAKKTGTVKQQLKELTNQLAALTLAGETETEEFQKLALQAGKLKNALADTQQTVGNLGEDVPTLRLFGAAVQGITSSFTLATGASALFGDENKDLQEVLVKVNAAMAISTGLSQLLALVNDEATVSTAKAIAAQTANNAQLAINNGLQSQSVIVRTGATVAQYALNLAMSLSPLGLLTIGLAAVIAGLAIFARYNKNAAKSQLELNDAIHKANELLSVQIQDANNLNKVAIAGLEERNARQSELDKTNLLSLQAQTEAREREAERLKAVILKNQNDTNSKVKDLVKEAQDKLTELEKQGFDDRAEIAASEAALRKQLLVESLVDQENAIQARLTAALKNSGQEFALQRQLAAARSAIDIQAAGDDAEKIKVIRAQLTRELKDIDIAQARVRETELESIQEKALIAAQEKSRAINDRGSQEELDREKVLILQRAQFQAAQEGVLQNERQIIIARANQQIKQMQRDFDKQQVLDALADQVSANNAVLTQVNLSEREKLSLRIDNIILAASAEIEQNRGKVQKIKEIEKQRDSDIKAARLQSIEDTVQKELALQEAQQAGATREIERQLAIQEQIRNSSGLGGEAVIERELNAQKLSVAKQLAYVDQLTADKLRKDQIEIASNEKKHDQELISDEDYAIKSAQLQDQAAKDFEDGEIRKTQIVRSENEKRLQHNKDLINAITEIASEAVNVLSTIYQQDATADQARIDKQRQNVQDLQAAGEITAKEAEARNKKLDAQQKQLQRQQAKRDKEIAIFNAVINTARAVTQALPNPVLAAIAAAIGAAEIAVIASRPIPQFGKGKKGNYEGFAEVGETGPEFVRRNGRLYLEDKPTITWLGASDKVFNPKETAAMIEARVPTNYYPGAGVAEPRGDRFDYDRMGKAVGANIPQYGVGFDVHGMYEYSRNKAAFTKYLTKRRSWGSK